MASISHKHAADKHRTTLWTSFAIIFLGFWLFFSPVTFGFDELGLGISDQVCGLILIITGFFSRSYKTAWVLWITAFIGVWLQFAPLLFWAKNAVIYFNDTLVGSLAIVFSILIPRIPFHSLDETSLVPKGWSYNPSSWAQRLPIACLATVGWFISRYLAAFQLGYIDSVWDPFFGDGTLEVITYNLSQSFPISDAGLGAMAYSLEMLLAWKGGQNRWCTMPWMVVCFGILVVPLGLVSVVLIMLQPIVVNAWCGLCLITAFCMMVMIALSVDEVVAVIQHLRAKRKDNETFWEVFWHGGSEVHASEDRRTPTLDAPWSVILPSMVWGVTIPWNLAVTTALGVRLMITPALFPVTDVMADLDHIIGAFVVVVSIISMGEVIRRLRRSNFLLGGLLLVFAFLQHEEAISLVNHIVVALAVIALSFPEGKIKERYGSQ